MKATGNITLDIIMPTGVEANMVIAVDQIAAIMDNIEQLRDDKGNIVGTEIIEGAMILLNGMGHSMYKTKVSKEEVIAMVCEADSPLIDVLAEQAEQMIEVFSIEIAESDDMPFHDGGPDYDGVKTMLQNAWEAHLTRNE